MSEVVRELLTAIRVWHDTPSTSRRLFAAVRNFKNSGESLEHEGEAADWASRFRQAKAAHDTMLATLTTCQARCTELLLENRDLKSELEIDNAPLRALTARHGEADKILREALGQETFNHLWGPGLEALGSRVDVLLNERDELIEEMQRLQSVRDVARRRGTMLENILDLAEKHETASEPQRAILIAEIVRLCSSESIEAMWKAIAKVAVKECEADRIAKAIGK